MVWVKSEYAEELAVLLTWLAALVPWSISYGSFAVTSSQDLTLVILRFPFVAIRYQLGVQLMSGTDVKTPVGFRQEVVSAGGNASAQIPGYDLWLVGVAVLAVALLVSFLLYFEVDALDDLPVDPVRLQGALLLALSLSLLGSSAYLFTTQAALFVPFGVLLQLAFGVILLRADRAVDEDAADVDASADA
ncbi:hypothetical protein G9C85_03135 [Halorubellus sp. JP-L1]|uniref:DUF7549 family protein n=1 Tax=Halorubellus sp. JP-L1 TaxID=2715753 RepID=UPI0014084C74|nr:hypothetical protein [Halorubellus sp. JP-L1]NHN40631.1 hypothetical protein [Halorubellus sp. JP-L1]